FGLGCVVGGFHSAPLGLGRSSLRLWEILIDIALEDDQDWFSRKVVLQCKVQISHAGINKVDTEVSRPWQRENGVFKRDHDMGAISVNVPVQLQRPRRDVWQVAKRDGRLNGIDLVKVDAGAIHGDDVLRLLDVCSPDIKELYDI